LEEKIEYERIKRKLQNMIIKKDDILHLNVSGVTEGFVVKRSVLTSVPGSILEAYFSGRQELTLIDGKIFVDRDPKTFEILISYLRNN
jgi:hypothetical protein